MASDRFYRLSRSFLTSAIWREPDHVRIVWITMLVLQDCDGIVDASVPGLADLARVPLENCVAALARMEGRYIEEVPRGWRMIDSRAEETPRARPRGGAVLVAAPAAWCPPLRYEGC